MTLHRRDEPMTVDSFLAFAKTRPDEERWELIDGEPILNPAPAWNHQRVVRNLMGVLISLEHQGASWEVLPGLGVVLSGTRVPVPDVLIRPAGRLPGSISEDTIVAFEVLSPSSKSRDLRWKRQNYPDLPSLMHYVVLSPETVDVRAFDRATGWAERRLQSGSDELVLGAVDVRLQVADLYHGLDADPAQGG